MDNADDYAKKLSQAMDNDIIKVMKESYDRMKKIEEKEAQSGKNVYPNPFDPQTIPTDGGYGQLIGTGISTPYPIVPAQYPPYQFPHIGTVGSHSQSYYNLLNAVENLINDIIKRYDIKTANDIHCPYIKKLYLMVKTI